jgi:hypothetical protein
MLCIGRRGVATALISLLLVLLKRVLRWLRLLTRWSVEVSWLHLHQSVKGSSGLAVLLTKDNVDGSEDAVSLFPLCFKWMKRVDTWQNQCGNDV